jgi:hypothetical protein
MMKVTERQVSAPGFLDRYVQACATAAPLVAFLTKALRRCSPPFTPLSEASSMRFFFGGAHFSLDGF